MTISKPIAFAALALSLATGLANAHEVWMLPSSTVLSSTGYVTVDGAVSNDLFYFNYRPMAIRDNLFITAPDGSAVSPKAWCAGNCAPPLTQTWRCPAPTAWQQ
jgi:hypothetical protein